MTNWWGNVPGTGGRQGIAQGGVKGGETGPFQLSTRKEGLRGGGDREEWSSVCVLVARKQKGVKEMR